MESLGWVHFYSLQIPPSRLRTMGQTFWGRYTAHHPRAHKTMKFSRTTFGQDQQRAGVACQLSTSQGLPYKWWTRLSKVLLKFWAQSCVQLNSTRGTNTWFALLNYSDRPNYSSRFACSTGMHLSFKHAEQSAMQHFVALATRLQLWQWLSR